MVALVVTPEDEHPVRKVEFEEEREENRVHGTELAVARGAVDDVTQEDYGAVILLQEPFYHRPHDIEVPV